MWCLVLPGCHQVCWSGQPCCRHVTDGSSCPRKHLCWWKGRDRFAPHISPRECEIAFWFAYGIARWGSPQSTVGLQTRHRFETMSIVVQCKIDSQQCCETHFFVLFWDPFLCIVLIICMACAAMVFSMIPSSLSWTASTTVGTKSGKRSKAGWIFGFSQKLTAIPILGSFLKLSMLPTARKPEASNVQLLTF